MAYYVFLGISRYLNRQPQVVIDRDGIALGFGRDRRFAWDDIQWVRLRRLALAPAARDRPRARGLHRGRPSACRCGASMTACGPIRGLPTAVLVRDNGLDTSASAMLDAVRAFRPNLVKS